jgi:hypothetical protein
MLPNTKICKICGKEYKYCKTESLKDIFRWRDVACCLEHGREYFRQVLEARSEDASEFETKETSATPDQKKAAKRSSSKTVDSSSDVEESTK